MGTLYHVGVIFTNCHIGDQVKYILSVRNMPLCLIILTDRFLSLQHIHYFIKGFKTLTVYTMKKRDGHVNVCHMFYKLWNTGPRVYFARHCP